MTGHVYAVVGGREDAGATTTALALGASLAEMSHRVGIVDADFGGPGIAAALDLPDGPRLRDVLRGDADPKEAFVDGPHGLEILPSEAGVPEPTDVRLHALVRATSAVRERFDVVLIDLGAEEGVPAAVALERADEVVLATPPDLDAVSATAEAATAARHHGADVLGTVVTRSESGGDRDRDALRATLDTDLLAFVPEDDAVPESADRRVSLLRHDPDSQAAMVYWELATRLIDGDVGDAPVVPRGGTESDESDESDESAGSDADDAGATAPGGDGVSESSPSDVSTPDGMSVDADRAPAREEFDWQDEPSSDAADADDADDEMEAAFKQTMEKVRKEREAEKQADGESDDEKSLFDGLIR